MSVRIHVKIVIIMLSIWSILNNSIILMTFARNDNQRYLLWPFFLFWFQDGCKRYMDRIGLRCRISENKFSSKINQSDTRLVIEKFQPNNNFLLSLTISKFRTQRHVMIHKLIFREGFSIKKIEKFHHPNWFVLLRLLARLLLGNQSTNRKP